MAGEKWEIDEFDALVLLYLSFLARLGALVSFVGPFLVGWGLA